jgi:hypothetical protein
VREHLANAVYTAKGLKRLVRSNAALVGEAGESEKAPAVPAVAE